VSDYVVDVKRSARLANGAVGRAICQDGARRRFDSRADAEAWAAELSTRAKGTVWIRAADPADKSPADGYLVARTGQPRLDGAYDKRRRRLNPPGFDQSGLERYERDPS
jgi:hypothetical protein